MRFVNQKAVHPHNHQQQPCTLTMPAGFGCMTAASALQADCIIPSIAATFNCCKFVVNERQSPMSHKYGHGKLQHVNLYATCFPGSTERRQGMKPDTSAPQVCWLHQKCHQHCSTACTQTRCSSHDTAAAFVRLPPMAFAAVRPSSLAWLEFSHSDKLPAIHILPGNCSCSEGSICEPLTLRLWSCL